MSNYLVPGTYEILPKHNPEMSLNAWEGATTPGTPIKLYMRMPTSNNTHFNIVPAGSGYESHIICAKSGLYLCMNGIDRQITTEMRPPTDNNIRWVLESVGDDAYAINSCSDGGNAQLNVRGANRDIGAEVITWVVSPDAAHAQFILKAI
ncbi:uncharacterized protein ALTATR162_LOCUS4313 [Alternaria atra]|uniref:Ricin B lectin domain-containing protein n=1 Tax=Alternaria atra TaxID=119953 RepID=A0A8J2N4S8_9PLEO|nr:uncharacterized protein ALTATR162_LOCUS4313 [Alternaria atra]CAG5156516.1 unnamed protein product [Alternaria atra]